MPGHVDRVHSSQMLGVVLAVKVRITTPGGAERQPRALQLLAAHDDFHIPEWANNPTPEYDTRLSRVSWKLRWRSPA